MLSVFDDLIADMLSHRKLNPVLTELCIRGKKINISLAFIAQYYFVVPKNMRLNSTPYFIMKIPSNKNFNKLHLIIHQILTLKTMNLYKNVLQNDILF